jgi:hypothetical protein
MEAYAITQSDAFEEANAQFEKIKAQLESRETSRLEHSALEGLLQREGSELLRLLFQAHLDLRSGEEQAGLRRSVRGADGMRRTHRRVTERSLMTLFGPVRVERVAYGAPGHGSLHPLDAELNLPVELASHGVRERVAEEAAKGSFDETVRSIERTTGAKVAKRQVEEATVRAAADFEAFYANREGVVEPDTTGSIVVVSVDGKGVVMRQEDLRAPTRRAAARRRSKLRKRRSKGEKSSSKRMATVATVYTIAPFERTPEDIVGELHGPQEEPAGRAVRPRPEHKRVWASVVQEPAEVIAEAFREARRRDPAGEKVWVALVDGNASQIELLQEAAARDGVPLTIVLDVIHVLEYLWAAAWALHAEGSAEGEAWVTERLERILGGQASHVAAGMRRSATRRGLSTRKREPIDRCAQYLLNHRELLRYDVALAAGFPIATGVIEGACRHLVKDRMDLTGARWRLRSAEAVLRLRSLRSSGDFDAYWRFHLEQERQRNHVARYAGGRIPRVRERPNRRSMRRRRHLRRVK